MIQPHESWNIIDSTKLQAYLECPRSYFFEYVLGWRPDTPNLHLEFGKAWHLAMEHLLTHGYAPDAVAEAWILLVDYYRKFWGPEMDESNAPKNPAYALRALTDYVNEYKDDRHEVLYTEIAGTVPVSLTRVIHFRMDSILRDLNRSGVVKSREHKTGSTLSRQWRDQWGLSIQTGTYNHVLRCHFRDREQIAGVEINGTFFQKKEMKFERVPANRTTHMMKAWLWEVNDYFSQIEADHERLLCDCKEDEPVMRAFNKNPTNCTKYFGCRFQPFCLAWPNPLQRVNDLPEGFIIEWWNPAEEESKAKHVFRLEEIHA